MTIPIFGMCVVSSNKALEYNEKAYKIDEELFAEHSINKNEKL